MTNTFSIIGPNPKSEIAMSLSSNAKRNIANSAMTNYLGDESTLIEAAHLLATSIIEREIGFASEDIAPDLFTELVAELTDPIISKLSELAN